MASVSVGLNQSKLNPNIASSVAENQLVPFTLDICRGEYVYRGTLLIRATHPPRLTIGP